MLWLVGLVLGGLCGADRVPEWAAEFRAGSELQAGLDAAIAAGADRFDLPAGSWRFSGRGLRVRGAVDLRISGAGPGLTQLWFEPGFGVQVADSVNLSLSELWLDCLTPPNAQGTLERADSGSIAVRIEPGFPLPDRGRLFAQSSEIKAVFWLGGRMVQGQQMNNPVRTARCDHERLCNLSLPLLSWWPPAGAQVTLSPRIWSSEYPVPSFYKGTVGIFNCSGCLFEAVSVFSSGDMVWVENLGPGANTYRRLTVARRPEPSPYARRLLAANNDGFHSMSCGVGPVLEDSQFGFLADDFVNIHNRLIPLAHWDARTSTAILLDVGDAPGLNYTATRAGGQGCAHVCTNQSCVFSHVDPALAHEVSAEGNTVRNYSRI